MTSRPIGTNLRAKLAVVVARIAAMWRGLTTVQHVAIAVVVGLVVLTLVTGVAFACITVALISTAAVARSQLGSGRGATTALVVACIAVLIGVAQAVKPQPVMPTLPPPAATTGDIASGLVHAIPDSAAAWIVAGDLQSHDTPTSAGVIAYEHALQIEPDNREAALRLAYAFSHMQGGLAVEQVAEYYTRLASLTPPAQPAQP